MKTVAVAVIDITRAQGVTNRAQFITRRKKSDSRPPEYCDFTNTGGGHHAQIGRLNCVAFFKDYAVFAYILACLAYILKFLVTWREPYYGFGNFFSMLLHDDGIRTGWHGCACHDTYTLTSLALTLEWTSGKGRSGHTVLPWASVGQVVAGEFGGEDLPRLGRWRVRAFVDGLLVDLEAHAALPLLLGRAGEDLDLVLLHLAQEQLGSAVAVQVHDLEFGVGRVLLVGLVGGDLLQFGRALFEEQDAVILGITVDNIPTLHAWTRQMGKMWFPVLSDFWPHGVVADTYGVLRSDGTTERALIIIDKQGIIRNILVEDINLRPPLDFIVSSLTQINKKE